MNKARETTYNFRISIKERQELHKAVGKFGMITIAEFIRTAIREKIQRGK